VKQTQSQKACRILDDFDAQLAQCIKVIPKDYKHMMQKIYHFEQEYERQEAWLAAFNDQTDVAHSGEHASTISVY
ncbi:hypothetical protein, partial [Staphylococcus chromogenes]